MATAWHSHGPRVIPIIAAWPNIDSFAGGHDAFASRGRFLAASI
ncbi:hypothetical protein IL54_0065 [Sphingobium sp. ba1]|nr:hypothetical protein IL54_0065 [Sphingobium sp. ba1]